MYRTLSSISEKFRGHRIGMVRPLLTLIVGVMIALPISNVCEAADDPILRKIEAVETDVPPKIDGKLDDLCWQKAAQTSNFIQFVPSQGEPATQETKIYLLYDLNRLYVGFECFKDDMENLAGSLTRRDSYFFPDDHVQLMLDTYLDRRNSYVFALNTINTQTEQRVINEGANLGTTRAEKLADYTQRWVKLRFSSANSSLICLIFRLG